MCACVSVYLCEARTHAGDERDYTELFCLNKEDRGSLVQIVIEIV